MKRFRSQVAMFGGRLRRPVRGLGLLVGLGLLAIYLVPALAASSCPPAAGQHHAAAIVLGYPANPNGSAGPLLRSRVAAAVRLYRAGAVRQLLFTGRAAHNAQVEALVMAAEAQRLGVPTTAIICETQARNTIENARFSAALLRRHGLADAVVVTSPSHLRRACVIFSRVPGRYVFQAAPYPAGFPLAWRVGLDAWEHLLLTRLYLLGDSRLPPPLRQP